MIRQGYWATLNQPHTAIDPIHVLFFSGFSKAYMRSKEDDAKGFQYVFRQLKATQISVIIKQYIKTVYNLTVY